MNQLGGSIHTCLGNEPAVLAQSCAPVADGHVGKVGGGVVVVAAAGVGGAAAHVEPALPLLEGLLVVVVVPVEAAGDHDLFWWET